MASETKNKISKKAKIIIAILLALVILSGGALAGRVIYLNHFADKGATVVVPDNLIGEDPEPSDNSGETESTGQPTESGSSSETTAAPETDNTSTPSSTDTDSNSNSANTQNKAATIALHKNQPSDNEKFTVENMFPGDTETKYFAVKVNHHSDVIVYFKAEVTEQTKQLADVLHIKVTHLDSDKVIYDGTFAEMSSDGYGVSYETTQSTESVAYYKIEVSLPTSTGNEYQAAKLMADFDWFVKDTGPLDSPQTGDNSNIALWVIIMCSSFAIILILLFGKRREKEREAV